MTSSLFPDVLIDSSIEWLSVQIPCWNVLPDMPGFWSIADLTSSDRVIVECRTELL